MKIQRGIFQEDIFSRLLFLIAIMSLNYIQRKCSVDYKFTKSQEKINHQKYNNDIKLFAKKKEKELLTLILTIRIYSQNIGMEFGIEKLARMIMKSGKREITEVMELPNKERLRTLEEKENYKYCDRNLIKGTNNRSVPFLRYSRPFLNWTEVGLRQMDQRTSKLMTVHKALHPSDT